MTSCLTFGKPPALFICHLIRILCAIYIVAAFFLIGKALWIGERDIYYRIIDPSRNHELMVCLAGLSLLIVAFVNIFAVNNSITRAGRAIFNLCNLAIFGLASRFLLSDHHSNNSQLQQNFWDSCKEFNSNISIFDDFVQLSADFLCSE